MPTFNIDSITRKYEQRAKSAGQDWVDGIVGSDVDTVGRAIASADIWHQAVSQPRAKEKYVSGLRSTSTAEIKAKVTKLGPARYTTGISAGVDKYKKNMAPVLNYIAAAPSDLINRAVVTPEDAAQKASDWVIYMSQYRRPA